jgi:hypothetical protein
LGPPDVAGGVNPGKSNILDAWTVFDQPASNTSVSVPFTRADDSGTDRLGVRLNRDRTAVQQRQGDRPAAKPAPS